jgi:predicted DNA-binding transcriptional regulator YafY
MKKKRTLLDIYILEILEKQASKDKPMLQSVLIEKLKEYPYEVEVSRNTLSAYVRKLYEDNRIKKNSKGIYKPGLFDDHELRLLIDGVLFGQHIPKEIAKDLIDKLKGMSELGLKNRVRHVYYLPNIVRTENKNLYEMIDKIDEAIQNNRKIRVKRCYYNFDKKLVPIKDEYILDPYYLVTEKSRYYLICCMEKNGKQGDGLVNLRVDRFFDVEILQNRPATDIRKIEKYCNGFQLDEYMREHLYMVTGKTVNVTMKLFEKNIGDFIDWYGKDFTVINREGDEIAIRFLVNDTALVFWALQYGKIATIISPASVRERMEHEVKLLADKYLK